MSEPRPLPRTSGEFETAFREHRINALVSVNLNTFWSITVLVVAFGLWDYYVDPRHWQTAFIVRLVGAALVTATGIFQRLPGKARWMPQMAKLRLIIAVVASLMAAAMLDTGFGYGVAGVAIIILTGPYVAIDARDLLKTNIVILALLLPLIAALRLAPFDAAGTIVFVVLAMLVSMLLGSVLETSYRQLFTLERELHRDARTDSLTGLDNRRAIQERGRNDVKLARRTSAPVSLILADFDNFKTINDRYGHEVGDAVLVKTAAILREHLRDSDAIGRWGGEEFVAVLPATHAAGAHSVAEKLRLAIAAAKFDDIPEPQTISLGVATSQGLDDPTLEWDLLIKEADQRLYRAKHEGRNRVVSS